MKKKDNKISLAIILKETSGFSLAEMVVATTIFGVLMLYIIGTMQLTFIGQSNVVVQQNIEESMRFAFELMSKELRMAQLSDNSCAGNVGTKKLYKFNAGNGLTFMNIYGECVNYSVPSSGANAGRLVVTRNGTAYPITPNDILVSSFDVSFIDFSITPGNRGRVTVKMNVANANGKIVSKNSSNFQLTVSSRYYDQDNE